MLTPSLAILISKQIGSLVVKKFGTSIVERWTRYRAEAFFNGFTQALAEEFNKGIELKSVDEKLDVILNDEKNSEVLFDAYRKVCFAKSKSLGPRIIGLLAGAIVLESRMSNDAEDQIFMAAEELSDPDLVEFFKSYRSYLSEAGIPSADKNKPHIRGETLIIPWSEDHRDSAWSFSRQKEIDTSPLDMHEALGGWAAALERLGIMASKMSHRQVEYSEDSERHINEDGTLDIYSYSVIFHHPAMMLAKLIERSLGAACESPQ